MPAPGVDNQEEAAILRTIHLNEVVAAAQRADAPHGSIKVDLIGAAELSKVNLGVQRMRNVSYLATIRDLLANQCIQLLKIALSLTKLHSLHAAANIDPNHARYDLVLDRHGGSDGTAFASVDIGHDPDLTSGKLCLIAHCLDLRLSCLLQLGSIADSSII